MSDTPRASRDLSAGNGDPWESCLRKDFTRSLMKDLLDRQRFVNLVGDIGQGRLRVVQDLKRCLPSEVNCIVENMKSRRLDHQEFMASISRKMGLTKPARRLDELFVKQQRLCILVLEDFDYLSDQKYHSQEDDARDPAFDKHFIAALNNLKTDHLERVRLLVASSRSCKNIYIRGLKSTLDLHSINMGKLSFDEVQAELHRTMTPQWQDWLAQSEGYKSLLLRKAHAHAQAFLLLHRFIERLEDRRQEELPFPNRLQHWTREFDRQKLSLERRVDSYKIRISRLWERTGIGKIRLPSLWSLIKGK